MGVLILLGGFLNFKGKAIFGEERYWVTFEVINKVLGGRI